MGGGGGGGTVESIPDWYKPYVEKAAGTAVTAYDQGQLGQVAGWNPIQQQAVAAQIMAGNQAAGNYDAAAGGANIVGQIAQQGYNPNITGPSEATQGIKNAAIAQAQKAWNPTGDNLARSNAVGGARAELLKGERDAALANQLAGIDYQDFQGRQQASGQAAQQSIQNAAALNQLGQAPADALQQAGGAIQQQQQAQLDAPYTGLAQLGGLLSGAPVPSQQQKAGK